MVRLFEVFRVIGLFGVPIGLFSLKSICEACAEVGRVEGGVEVENACGFDLALEDGAPVGVDVVACTEAEDRLPCALHLEIVDVG